MSTKATRARFDLQGSPIWQTTGTDNVHASFVNKNGKPAVPVKPGKPVSVILARNTPLTGHVLTEVLTLTSDARHVAVHGGSRRRRTALAVYLRGTGLEAWAVTGSDPSPYSPLDSRRALHPPRHSWSAVASATASSRLAPSTPLPDCAGGGEPWERN